MSCRQTCASAHYWAREIQALGHEVRLIPPQYVRPFVKTNKNDAADAEAICEAVTRPTMRFAAAKSAEQQSVLMPSSNCLIRDVETTLGKQVLNVPIAQRETAIEPDGMLDDDRWKAVTTVGYLAHPETLKHRPCRSHAVNVTMPLKQQLDHLEWRARPAALRHVCLLFR